MIKKIYRWLLQKSARPEDRGGVSAGYWQGRIRQIALESVAQAAGRALDIGCGEGLFLRDMVRANPHLRFFGLDLSMPQLEVAKGKALSSVRNVHLIRADALNLPFKEGLFDRVVFLNLIINMPGEESAYELVREAGRVCGRRGSVIFDIRNKRNPLIRIKYNLARYYDATVTSKDLPLTMCDPREIEKIVSGAGMEVVKRSYIGFPKGDLAPVIIIEARKT